MGHGSAPLDRDMVWLNGPKSPKLDGKWAGYTRHSSSLINAQNLDISKMCNTFKLTSQMRTLNITDENAFKKNV
jgi:hypothetical protein